MEEIPSTRMPRPSIINYQVITSFSSSASKSRTSALREDFLLAKAASSESDGGPAEYDLLLRIASPSPTSDDELNIRWPFVKISTCTV